VVVPQIQLEERSALDWRFSRRNPHDDRADRQLRSRLAVYGMQGVKARIDLAVPGRSIPGRGGPERRWRPRPNWPRVLVRLWSVGPAITRDNRGYSRTLIQQIVGCLASSTEGHSVAYNDEVAGSSPATPTALHLTSAFVNSAGLVGHCLGPLMLKYPCTADGERITALLSSDDFGSSVERDGGGHPL
jgi:hypothetical protein